MVDLVNVLDHVSVTVRDMERSLAFYRDLLGLKVAETHHLEGETIEKMTGKPGVVMEVVRLEAPETPGIMLDLQQYLSPSGGVSNAQLGDVAHSHICYGVKDVWATYRAWEAKGVKFVSEPVSFDLEWGIVHVVFLKDPDGYMLELMQHPIEMK